MEKILIITGPTASGKTSFSIECAKLINGEIISADSMQIYKDLDIGTAKLKEQEMEGITHYLINVVEANEEYSVQEFVSLAREKIEDITRRGKIPIIVGGTGLYIKSLIYPYSFGLAKKNTALRDKYNSLAKEKGGEYLYSLLVSKDKEASKKIHPNDTKKIIRALEIIEQTGKTKTEQNVNENTAIYDFVMVALTMERSHLYKRINDRVDIMFDKGLMHEVENLIKSGKVTWESQSMQAIGYKEFKDYFSSKISLEELKELIKKNSRHYAKRQLTFIRGFENTVWFDIEKEREKAKKYIARKFKENKNGN